MTNDKPGFLTLGRKFGQSIVLQREGEDDIVLMFREAPETTVDVRVSIQAPRSVRILRKELVE